MPFRHQNVAYGEARGSVNLMARLVYPAGKSKEWTAQSSHFPPERGAHPNLYIALLGNKTEITLLIY